MKALIVMGVDATAVAPRPLAPVHRPGPRRPDPHRRLGVLPGPGVVRRAGVGLLLALVVSGCSPDNETPATTTVTVTTTPVVSTATPTPPPPPPPVQKGQWAYDDMLAFKVCWAYHTDDNATVFMWVQNVGAARPRTPPGYKGWSMSRAGSSPQLGERRTTAMATMTRSATWISTRGSAPVCWSGSRSRCMGMPIRSITGLWLMARGARRPL